MTSTKVVGSPTKRTAVAPSWILKAPSTPASGWRTSSTGRARRAGTRGEPGTRDSSSRGRRMGRESLYGKMGAIIKETLLMGTSRDRGSTTLRIWIKFMKENSGCLLWKEEDKKFGLMAENMREISKMVKKMAKELSNGQMEIST